MCTIGPIVGWSLHLEAVAGSFKTSRIAPITYSTAMTQWILLCLKAIHWSSDILNERYLTVTINDCTQQSNHFGFHVLVSMLNPVWLSVLSITILGRQQLNQCAGGMYAKIPPECIICHRLKYFTIFTALKYSDAIWFTDKYHKFHSPFHWNMIEPYRLRTKAPAIPWQQECVPKDLASPGRSQGFSWARRIQTGVHTLV